MHRRQPFGLQKRNDSYPYSINMAKVFSYPSYDAGKRSWGRAPLLHRRVALLVLDGDLLPPKHPFDGLRAPHALGHRILPGNSGCCLSDPSSSVPSFPRTRLCFSVRVAPNLASRQICTDARSGSALNCIMRRLALLEKHWSLKRVSRTRTSRFDLAGVD